MAPNHRHREDDDAAGLTRFRGDFERTIESLRLSRNMSTRASAAALRRLVASGGLRYDDVERRPARFFEAHRALARATATTLGPGFWIRFTVTYNLCFGTVQALGTREHRRRAREARARGALGCFCLTERLAGVNSGLVVNTTATWDQGRQTFVIESGGEGGTKNWISNGFRADSAVVVANLIVGGEAKGPHGFYVELRRGVGKRLARGITMGDMGTKTTANDLDNFWIRFDGFEAPRESLLSKYGSVNFETGEYEKKSGGASTMDMIGQRLYTGRVAVAQAALAFTRRLYDDTKKYSDTKMCVMRGSSPFLSDVPQLRALYAEGYAALDRLDAFVARCERELCEHLRAQTIPSADLTRAIAVSKIKAVEASIDLSFRLKQEVGSYALMAGTGFDNTDFLQCCKFAEGDSRILSQKLARDCFGAYKRSDGGGGDDGPISEVEVEICRRIDAVVRDAREANPDVHKIDAWDCAWREVYELAEVICERVMHERSVDGETLRSKL
tara:strand:+ start:409 stop:1914 length:1506 start_codon:yes stop_codon:yes gene_type:complete